MSDAPVLWPDAATLVEVLEPLQALAIAVIGPEGRVRNANRGFRSAVGADDATSNAHAATFLVLPTFESLRDADAFGPEGTLYRGRITLQHASGDATTLRGEVRRHASAYLLVAEHETQELQAMAAAMIDLTEQMARTQRELVQTKHELEARERELAAMAITDPLTGLANRRELDRRLSEEIARSQRTGAPLSLVMLDLDRFKAFNDRYGHPAGDDCLRTVAGILAKSTRPYDVVARYGGEEFVLMLPGTDQAEAVARAEDLRAEIARSDLPGMDARITASFGVASFADRGPGRLMRAADDALYEAKRAGRNRVHAAGA